MNFLVLKIQAYFKNIVDSFHQNVRFSSDQLHISKSDTRISDIGNQRKWVVLWDKFEGDNKQFHSIVGVNWGVPFRLTFSASKSLLHSFFSFLQSCTISLLPFKTGVVCSWHLKSCQNIAEYMLCFMLRLFLHQFGCQLQSNKILSRGLKSNCTYLVF